jgi:hypothetical protein
MFHSIEFIAILLQDLRKCKRLTESRVINIYISLRTILELFAIRYQKYDDIVQPSSRWIFINMLDLAKHSLNIRPKF